jgi:hypothetical protein
VLEDKDFRVILPKLAYWEPIFQLTQTLLFILRSFLHYIEPHMENVGYKCSVLVIDQSGVISLQDILITYFSYDEPVWDVNKEKMWCSGGPEHLDIGCVFI